MTQRTGVRARLVREDGFTLIELLVVVLIIGILAAVAIPTFLSQKNKASAASAKSDVRNAQTLVEAFVDGNAGTYPVSTALEALPSAVTGDSSASSLTNVYFKGAISPTRYVVAEYVPTGATTYWISVVSGQTYYGATAGGSATAPSAPTPGDTTGSPTGWLS